MLLNLLSRRVPPIVLHVAVNGQEVPVELDTGASAPIITKCVGDDAANSPSVATSLAWKYLSECRLQPTAAHLPTGGCEGRGTMSGVKRLAPTLQSTLALCAPHHSTQSSKCQPDLGGSGW